MLLCEQSKGYKQQFYFNFKDLFNRQGDLKNHVVSTKFNYPLCPIQEKGRRIPIQIQDKVQSECTKLLLKGRTQKLEKCTSDCFTALIVIKVKNDDSIKLAFVAKLINRQLYKNKYQMPNVDEFLYGVSQIVTTKTTVTLYLTELKDT